MKKTINNSNKYFSTALKVDNYKTTKQELKEHCKTILTTL
jgi:hypothetical protein